MNTPDNNIEAQSSKIELSNNPETINNIRLKLKEYRERLKGEENNIDEYKAPEQAFQMLADTKYKIAVCEKLLLDGGVDTHELSRELNERDGMLDSNAFNNACGVIEDYVKTGGKNTSGGTGFGEKIHIDAKLEEMKNKDEQNSHAELEKIRGELGGAENKKEDSQEAVVEKIKELGEDEEELFNLRKDINEFIKETVTLKNEGKIDEEARIKLVKSISAPMTALHKSFAEKMGTERYKRVNSLIGEYIQNEIPNEIKNAKNFEELFVTLDKVSTIMGSEQRFSVDDLKIIINSVRNGERGINSITRTHGLREKVSELIKRK